MVSLGDNRISTVQTSGATSLHQNVICLFVNAALGENMIDTAAYRANETNAKRAIADWQLSKINDPYVFQNAGFPVRADSFLDLAQIIDTMHEGQFDYWMKELGGFTEEDTDFFVKACLDYVDFYSSFFQRRRVIVPLSTLIAHFVLYKKLLGYKPGFKRLLEIGPGCGYLSFFLRDHESLDDYTQIESTESFYLLQSHINSHVFGSRFAEHALSRHALDDHGAYVPKLKWHNPHLYEEQKIINVEFQSICNHYPWWRIGEVAKRRYDIVTSNANLNEFSREALFQYLSLIRDVLVDDGVIIAQCLGGGPRSYESILADMKSAGFVPVALIRGGKEDNLDDRVFITSNGIFVGEKHPLYAKYANLTPKFPMLDRDVSFINKMYFPNEEQPQRKQVLTMRNILHAILDEIEPAEQHSGGESQKRALELDVSVPVLKSDAEDSSNRTKVDIMLLAAEVENHRHEIERFRSSMSWRVTAPLRSMRSWVRRLLPFVVRLVRPFVVRLVRWLRGTAL